MNEDTRARKQARLGRLRVEVAALELELAALQLSASSSDGDGDCSDDGSETSAASGSSMDIEQGGCGLDGDDKADEGDSPSDSDEDDDPLGLSGGVAVGFTGPVGGGFWGGSPPATPPAPPLTHVSSPPGAGAAGGDLRVHPPIAHPNTLHCPPCSIAVDCNCVSGQLDLGCCVKDDAQFGPGDLYSYFERQREEASRTSNFPRDGNNLHHKRMYQHSAVSPVQPHPTPRQLSVPHSAHPAQLTARLLVLIGCVTG